MNVLLFGATGMVGQGVLRECILDPDVQVVQTVGRTATGVQHTKLKEIVQKDLHHYSSVEADLSGFDACFFCLGVSSVGMKETDYERITYGIALAAAKTLSRLGEAAADFRFDARNFRRDRRSALNLAADDATSDVTDLQQSANVAMVAKANLALSYTEAVAHAGSHTAAEVGQCVEHQSTPCIPKSDETRKRRFFPAACDACHCHYSWCSRKKLVTGMRFTVTVCSTSAATGALVITVQFPDNRLVEASRT